MLLALAWSCTETSGLRILFEGKECYMGSVPLQLLIVANIATRKTCDTMGDTSKVTTCVYRATASKQEKTRTHTQTLDRQATWAHASKIHGIKSPHQ